MSAARRPVRMLPEEVVRRIAAGEVIVRPAHAVKELVENSLDAGATHVRVEVKAGGKNQIRVSDNGVGMSRDDLRLAVARHATSKLERVEDLSRIESYGFRGEALASIGAVSRLVIETNASDSGPGTAIEVEGGDVRSLREVVRPRGTTVSARTLFFNLPVRRVFLKSDNYEARLVAETVRSYALAFPEVGFEFVNNDRVVLKLAPAGSVRERAANLFEKRVAESFVELKVDNPLLSLRGFLAEPTQARSFYDVQGVYLNRRPVRNHTVTRAVYEGYGPVLAGNNPNFIVLIQTDPARLDVNLHPTKQEVRFADERFLFDFVSEAVSQTLGIRRGEGSGMADFLYQRGFVPEDAAPQDFWQLHNSYIIAQVSSGYVIVDQHAAHERILYEEVLKARQQVSAQGLLFPITVELNPEEFEAWTRAGELLLRMGIESKLFSGNTVVVETVPAGSFMGRDEVREFFSELARLTPGDAGLETDLARLVACKAAVKAGQRLAQPEMESLINRLFACREPYFCPHGRPAIVKITLDDLERRFGRT
ncbi:DNA mismatch repair endonuclease MutL [candidate division WOR-3 bacterium]|nr:DNA mismatch repair endonuclease MutL [candidate division WOR-3 bacterium]